MGSLARKCVDAVQNSLLGALLAHLWPFLLVAQWADASDGGPYRHSKYILGAYVCAVVFVFLAWLLGFLANHERPKDRGPFDRIQSQPRNGFEAWSRSPAGGLKPPRLTKAFVMTLGQEFSRRWAWLKWLGVFLVLAAVALSCVAYSDWAWLASISPSLASPAGRVALFWGVSVIVLAAILRNWAVDSRKRIEADAATEGPI